MIIIKQILLIIFLSTIVFANNQLLETNSVYNINDYKHNSIDYNCDSWNCSNKIVDKKIETLYSLLEKSPKEDFSFNINLDVDFVNSGLSNSNDYKNFNIKDKGMNSFLFPYKLEISGIHFQFNKKF